MLNLPIFPVIVRRQKKSQKYFDLLAVKQIFFHSNPSSSVDAMNFPKWELFFDSSDIAFNLYKDIESYSLITRTDLVWLSGYESYDFRLDVYVWMMLN